MNSQPVLLRRPFHSEMKAVRNNNIFQPQSIEGITPLPKIDKLPNIYDFVGPKNIRDQIMEQRLKESKPIDSLTTLEQKQQQAETSKSMQTTLKQQTVRSNLTLSQSKHLTKDLRNMQKFKERQLQWDRQSDKIRRSTERYYQPTLLERSKKQLQVIPNPEKDDIIKNYVTSYWQMSLRNNSLILKRHLKGNNRYNQNQMQSLLQRDEGIRQVEESIPKLPIKELNRLGDKQLVMLGKNKLASQSMSCDPSLVSEWTSRRSRGMTELPSISNRQEFFKVDYDSAHKFIEE